MNEITFTEAHNRALRRIRSLANQQHIEDLIIVEDAIVETNSAWYFPYNSAEFLLGGNVLAALAGNLPIKVPRDGSSLSCEEPPVES